MHIHMLTRITDTPMAGFTSAEAGVVGAAMATDITVAGVTAVDITAVDMLAAVDSTVVADSTAAADSTVVVATVVADTGNQ
jgi:hypothetical protein